MSQTAHSLVLIFAHMNHTTTRWKKMSVPIEVAVAGNF